MDIKLEYNQPKPITLSFLLRVREADRSAFRKQTGLAEPTLGTATITLKQGDIPNEYFALLTEGVRQQPELTVPYPCTEEAIHTSLQQTLEADLTGKQLFSDLQAALENYREDFSQRHDQDINTIEQKMQEASQQGDPQQGMAVLEDLGQRLEALQQEFNAGQRIIIERFYIPLQNCPTIQLRTANESDQLYDLIYRARVCKDHHRLGLSESTGSYGPSRLNRLLEKHDNITRNQRDALEALTNETRKRQHTEAINGWIAQYGSERLKLAREQGYPIDKLYYQERTAQILSDLNNRYYVDFDHIWQATIKTEPSLEALRLEKQLRGIAPEVASLVVLAAPIHSDDPQLKRAQEMVCLSGLFDGCPEVYVEPKE